MTVHPVGARSPAGLQDANYFAQDPDADSGARPCVQLPARLKCGHESPSHSATFRSRVVGIIGMTVPGTDG